MSTRRAPKVPITIYADEADIDRLTRVMEAFRERLPGMRFTRSNIARAVLRIGLDVVGRALTLWAAPKAPAKPRARTRRRG